MNQKKNLLKLLLFATIFLGQQTFAQVTPAVGEANTSFAARKKKQPYTNTA